MPFITLALFPDACVTMTTEEEIAVICRADTQFRSPLSPDFLYKGLNLVNQGLFIMRDLIFLIDLTHFFDTQPS